MNPNPDVSRKFKDILRQGIACKMEGICDRDKIVNDYLRVRVDAFARRMGTINEIVRDDADLPRCPPDCEKEDETECDETVIVHCEKEITATVTGEE